MKHLNKILGIIALTALIGFSMTACDPGGGGGGGGALGDTLTLSGQTYDIVYGDNGVDFTEYTGNAIVSSGYRDVNGYWEPLYASGVVNNGQLSFSIGEPDELIPVSDMLPAGATASDVTAKGISLQLTTGGGSYLVRMNETMSLSGGSVAYTKDSVMYMYVDKNVIGSSETITESAGGMTITRNAYNVSLQEGWNQIYVRTVNDYSAMTVTITVSTSQPSNLKWVFED